MLSDQKGGNTVKKHVNVSIVLLLIVAAAFLAAAHDHGGGFGFFSGG
jgi:hypothetical protein